MNRTGTLDRGKNLTYNDERAQKGSSFHGSEGDPNDLANQSNVPFGVHRLKAMADDSSMHEGKTFTMHGEDEASSRDRANRKKLKIDDEYTNISVSDVSKLPNVRENRSGLSTNKAEDKSVFEKFKNSFDRRGLKFNEFKHGHQSELGESDSLTHSLKFNEFEIVPRAGHTHAVGFPNSNLSSNYGKPQPKHPYEGPFMPADVPSRRQLKPEKSSGIFGFDPANQSRFLAQESI